MGKFSKSVAMLARLLIAVKSNKYLIMGCLKLAMLFIPCRSSLMLKKWIFLFLVPICHANDSVVASEKTKAVNEWDDAQYTQLLQVSKQSERQYKDNILQYWPKAIVSDKTTWVNYSEQWKVRRLVDFEKNQIEVSFETLFDNGGLDYQSMEAKLDAQLASVLSVKLTEDEYLFDEYFDEFNPQASIEKVKKLWLKKKYIKPILYSAMTSDLTITKKTTYVVPLPDDALMKRAYRYQALVKENAEFFDLDPALVFAIIHTESHFNPLAKSHIPAYGLMQIVPRTAGKDATKRLFKRPLLLSDQYLFVPENNIKIGAAYFNLIYFQYFRKVQSPQARLYLTVASYNGGLTSVAKVFHKSGRLQEAIPVLNQMQSDQVLMKLTQQLKSKETRDYVDRVLKRIVKYEYM